MASTHDMAPAQYSTRVDRALLRIARDFRYKERKQAGHPYLYHLLQVAVTVAEHGGDEDQQIAALLHDTLEDVEGDSPQKLTDEFGPRVAELVVALSDSQTPGAKEPWRPRKEKYLLHLRAAGEDVKLVSAADKLHNARSIRRDLENPEVGVAVWRRFKPTVEDSLWYYREVLAALRVVAGGCVRSWELDRLVNALDQEVRAIHRLSGAEDSF